MKVNVNLLDEEILDTLVAVVEGRALRMPVRGTDDQASRLTVPFIMYEPVATMIGDCTTYSVREIRVTRFGILPGCSLPTIDFTDSSGRRATGSVDLFYFDLSEAELDCRGSEKGWSSNFHPSTDWAQGGPIIERERIHVYAGPQWTAGIKPGQFVYGPTALIAAMRCFVASKLGNEVDVPEDLLNQTRLAGYTE